MFIWIIFGKLLEIVGKFKKKYNFAPFLWYQNRGKANLLNNNNNNNNIYIYIYIYIYNQISRLLKNVEFWTILDVFPLFGIHIYSSLLSCEIGNINVLKITVLLDKNS